jgi:hypothetical protein
MTRANVDLSKGHSTYSCWNNVDRCWVHVTRDAKLIQEMSSMIVQESSRYGIYVNLLPNHWWLKWILVNTWSWGQHLWFLQLAKVYTDHSMCSRRNFPLWKCQRVVLSCWCIWSICYCQCVLVQAMNQHQFFVFLARVALLVLVPSYTFWSLHRCLPW